MNTVGGVAYSG